MRIILTGATGLIGSVVLGRLRSKGHDVVAVTRSPDRLPAGIPKEAVLRLDIARADRPGDWLPHLVGVDAVINCAGVLQDSTLESTEGVHARGVAALAEACERAGVRRIIHLSAIGVDRGALTEFSRTKLAGDEALMARDLDWVILRPSVVLGRPAYGGSAMFRGLAALPVLPLAPNTGQLQVVQLDDLVETIFFFLRPDAPSRQILEIAGPERLEFVDVIRTYRDWLGWPPAWTLTLPAWASSAMYMFGDFAGMLGWRPAIRSTAKREIVRGAVGDHGPWTRITGIIPRSLGASLIAEPASVQERWFAQLYFLKPLVLGIFALFWIMTGIISLGPGWAIGVGLMQEGGAGRLAAPIVAGGALVDILIGIGIAFRRTARAALYVAMAISIFYMFAGTFILPRLWDDPLGALLKVLPILALNFVALAILEDR